MKQVHVGIFSPGEDEQARAVASAAESLGGEIAWLDPETFPGNLDLSDRDGERLVGDLPDSAIAGWYVRYFHVSDLPDPHANAERSAFLTSWLQGIERGRRMINPVAAMQQNLFKPYQLERLRRAGVPVPRTLVTNVPAHALEFVAAVGEAVYKPVSGGSLAQEWTPADAEHLHVLRRVPLIFQERLRGITLRVHVLEDEVLDAVRVDSEHLDYRTADFLVTHVDLAPDARRVCVAAARAVDMPFAAIDAFTGEDGAVTVLELNPTPYFLAYDGAAIAERLAAYLLGR